MTEAISKADLWTKAMAKLEDDLRGQGRQLLGALRDAFHSSQEDPDGDFLNGGLLIRHFSILTRHFSSNFEEHCNSFSLKLLEEC